MKLQDKAKQIRRTTIDLLYQAQSGHPGSSLSIIDLVTNLYFQPKIFKKNPKNSHWPERDYFLLSNGHAVPGLYSCLAHAGYYPLNKLKNLRKINSPLQGHPKKDSFPGIECSSGSLGQGLSVGIGIALGAKKNHQKNRVWVMTSDGEQQEGSTWEAVMLAPVLKLNNLVVIIDNNLCQISGPTKTIMPSLKNLAEKYQNFGWQTVTIDGHNHNQIQSAYKKALKATKPFAIIANTIIGKGVTFMEGNYQWHHGNLDEQMYQQALKELS